MQLKALGHDDHPNVANLIGYSYRKLGDYRLSQVWYERALKSDPNHVLTWQYYGLWQIEQGNRDQARLSSEPDRRDLRNRLRGVSLAGRGAGKTARHRPRLLSSLSVPSGRLSSEAPPLRSRTKPAPRGPRRHKSARRNRSCRGQP